MTDDDDRDQPAIATASDERAQQVLVEHQQRLLLSGPRGQAIAEFSSLACLGEPPAGARKH